MMANKVWHWAAVLVLAAGGGIFVSQAMTQDTKPPADKPADKPAAAAPADGPSAADIAERLRARGIQVTPEQVEQGRKIMETVRDGGQVDPEQIQKLVADFGKQVQARAQERIKEALGATDAEWQVLAPKVEAVQKFMLTSGPIGMGLARFGMGGINLAGGTDLPDVQKKSQTLQEILKNKDAATDDVRTALKDYRDAKVKSTAELAKARAELKELLTMRQEAVLVRMGMLE